MITLTSISKRYGSQHALKDVNLTIPKGVFGLLGSNGAGKTTLLSILCGLIAPDQGSCTTKHSIGCMLQKMQLYPNKSVQENLHYLGKITHAQSNALIEEFQVQPLLKKKVKNLSHGEHKLLLILSAFLTNPAVVILDEPLSGFDPRRVVFLRELIAKRSKKQTIILSSHHLDEVSRLCTHLGILHEGRLLCSGSKKQVCKGLSLEKAFIKAIEKSADSA